MTPPRLSLQSVTKTFGGVRALDNVSFDVQAGEIHALVGENGAGKSTLVRVMTGATTPDSGRMEIDGHLVTGADPTRMRARGVAAIYQQPALCPDLSVAENLGLRAEGGTSPWRRVRWGARRQRARAALQRVGASIDVDAPARSLGMAEQQLLEIASALDGHARILVLDEPTAALTDRETTRLFEMLRTFAAEGVAIVYISHRLEDVEALAARVSVLRDGALVATRPKTSLTRDEMIRLMVGRDVQRDYPTRSAATHEVVLDVADLGCRTSGLANISFHIRAGEILGVAGLVGAGRTELARTLFGLTPADRGTIRMNNRPVAIDSPVGAVRVGLAYVPEDRRAYGVIAGLSVAANITLADLDAVSHAGTLDRNRERAIATEYVQRLAIKTTSVDALVSTLSGGNQQKVVLGRWLAVKPRVLILDEPTQGVDVGAKAEIHRIIADLSLHGLAILLISSDLDELFGMSDRVAVMRGGTIVGALERHAATAETILALAVGHVPAQFQDSSSEVRH